MTTRDLHPLNQDFSWAVPQGPYRRLTDEQVECFDKTGFFVFEEAFDALRMEEVIAEIDPFEEQTEEFLRRQEGGRIFIARAGEITFTTHLVTRSEVLRGFAAGKVFQDLAYDLIGEDTRLYWDQAVYKKPGNPAEFPWHQDNGYTFIRPQQYVTCWVALTDTDEENGCPWVVPGVHREGTLRHWMTDLGWCCLEEPEDAIPIPLRAGSIAVFSSLTPHRTGPNLTGGVRKSYILQYAPDGACMVADGTESPCNAPDRQFFVLEGGRAPA